MTILQLVDSSTGCLGKQLITHTDTTDRLAALADLLNRIRSGEVSAEQASKESVVIANLLKAYDIVEVKAKLDELEAIVGGRK